MNINSINSKYNGFPVPILILPLKKRGGGDFLTFLNPFGLHGQNNQFFEKGLTHIGLAEKC